MCGDLLLWCVATYYHGVWRPTTTLSWWLLISVYLFYIFVVLFNIYFLAHSSVLTILPEHAVECGLDKHEGSFLVSIIGIANILGRLMAGV